jgi:hypothetical protein
MKRRIVIALLAAVATSAWAPARADVVTSWNSIIVVCVQGQTAPVAIAPNRPGAGGLLDVALVHAAMHDAVQAIQGRFEPYHYDNAALRGVGSVDAAAAAAAYGLLVELYGADDPCLVGVTNPAVTYAGDPGLQAGNESATALFPLYRPSLLLPGDPNYMGGTAPGEWRPTLPTLTPALFRFLAVTAPFVLNRPSQFRPPRQPPLSSVAYAREYNEVKRLGAKNDTAWTTVGRTAEQTDLANFWLTNPFHAWHATVRSIAEAHLTDVGDTARLFALVSLASADAGISCFESKFHYNFWRPETAIREGDNDGNPGTAGDPDWLSFIPSPPYPDHSSGANNLSGSITRMLALYFGSDEFEFSITSSTPGLLVNPRSYHRFSDAAREVVDVRVYHGVHFRTADAEARRQGGRVAHWVFKKSLRPLPGTN